MEYNMSQESFANTAELQSLGSTEKENIAASDTSEAAIVVSSLSKCYDIYERPVDRLKQFLFPKKRYSKPYWALQEVCFSVKKGETIGIIGHNGSGKSTLLQLVCGTLSPTTGNIQIRGRIAALLELGAGFNPEFTGLENIFLVASILGVSEKDISQRIESICAFAEIGDFVHQPVKMYSSGMYARLAFAVALHVDADILVIDEILSVGDAAFSQKCMRAIREFKKKGTIFFVSHDMGAVVGLCDKALWLDAGQPRAFGAAKDVCREYLAETYRRVDSSSRYKIGGRRASDVKETESTRVTVDCRHEEFAVQKVLPQMQLYDFDPEAPWVGTGSVEFTRVCFLNTSGDMVSSVMGGDEVILQIQAKALVELDGVIIGFSCKDRLGQSLFGDNTYLSTQNAPVRVAAGELVEARFRFFVPYLPKGHYAMNVALATGSQDTHTQHRMVDDALIFEVINENVAKGLMGIPMLSVSLQVEE
jgi:lipopolysaccharide transport system ATP-binding protein